MLSPAFNDDPEHAATTSRPRPRAAFGLILAALLLRLIHLAAAAQSPLSFQVGPDEDYYLRFARDVAFGSGGMRPEFAFMDPLYGYLLGAILWLTGGSPFPMFVLQVVVDTATVAMLVALGRRIGMERAGLIGAAAYALVGPAIAMTATLLKEIWVAAFLCGWVLLVLQLRQPGPAWRWFAFGLYFGVGVLLRSNLLLLAPFGLAMAWAFDRHRLAPMKLLGAAALLMAGLALPLGLATWRNIVVDGRASPVPGNGGLVMHQLYNEENPESRSRYPSFVRYGHPSEAWRAYHAEAEKRHGRGMSAPEVDAYWRALAIDYVWSNPGQTLRNALRKLAEFSAWPEVANNRSYADERLFSPVLAALPPPFGLLFAFGLPGLIWTLRGRFGAWTLWPPVLAGIATVAVFFAEDRFRLIVVPFFALGTGLWLLAIWGWLSQRRWRSVAAGAACSMVLAIWSFAYAQNIPATPSNWQRIGAGWFKMGKYQELRSLLDEAERLEPGTPALDEFRGLLALAEGDPAAARSSYERALAQRSDRHEVWHNYARALFLLGDLEQSLTAEVHAYQLAPLPEYLWEIALRLEGLGRQDEATDVMRALASNPEAGEYALRARARLGP